LADRVLFSRKVAFVYVALLFYVLPAGVILVYRSM
jgi:hypothetical protein